MNIVGSNATVAESSRVTFDGADLKRLPKAAARHFWGPEIAMVFQDPMTSLNPVKRVGVQIAESMRYHLGVKRAVARRRALDLLSQVGIPEPRRRLDEYPHQLSGGMRQRVSIAIALACDPKLLIADEPTTALDVTVQRQILDLLAGLQRERSMAMILVTHDLGVVASRAQRVAVMYAGRIVEIGDTRTTFEHMHHPYAEALLRSSPRIRYPSHTRLLAIAGHPPDMARPPAGCRFAPRCTYRRDVCMEELPLLNADPRSAHAFACHFPVTVDASSLAESVVAADGATEPPVLAERL